MNTRAGVYFTFESKAQETSKVGDRGVVLMNIEADFGKVKEFVEITSENYEDVLKNIFGHSIEDVDQAYILYIREALKNADKVIVYRTNGSTDGIKASNTFGTTNTCTVTAQHKGTRGNKLVIKVTDNVVAGKDVATYLDGVLADTQTVTNIQELVANNWVTFAGTGAIENTAGTTLTTGADGATANGDVTDFINGAETQDFDVMAFMSTDSTLKASMKTKIQYFREEAGKKVQAVTTGLDADYEGIIETLNGVVLEDGTVLTALQVIPWVAGATAGATITQSNTHKAYDGAKDANPRKTNAEIIAGIKAGKFVFTAKNGMAIVEKDINSLKTLTTTKGAEYQKNRAIRTLDAINNDIKELIETTYLGKITNNADGRTILKTAQVGYFNTIQNAGAIEGFTPEDIVIDETQSTGDVVVEKIGVKVLDSIEKVYIDIATSQN